MIFLAVAGPTPGSASSCAWVAVLSSTGPGGRGLLGRRGRAREEDEDESRGEREKTCPAQSGKHVNVSFGDSPMESEDDSHHPRACIIAPEGGTQDPVDWRHEPDPAPPRRR